MEEEAIIYVAGNPNAYPLEYYDSQSETYQGLMPQLYGLFSQQSDYEIQYYPSQGADQREHLGENLQVDLLSGYAGEEGLPETGEPLALFQTEYQGEQVCYYVSLTQAAPEGLKEALEEFFAGVSQQEISGILMSASVPPQTHTGFYLAIGGLTIGLVVLASVLAWVLGNYRKKLRKSEQGLETNPVTGLGNFDYLLRYYKQLVNDQNRILYSAVYFYVDVEELRRLGSNLEQDEFLRYCAVILQEHAENMDILAQVSEHGFAVLKFSSTLEQVESWLTPLFHRLHGYPGSDGSVREIRVTAGIYPLKREDRDLNEVLFHASRGAYEAQQEQREFMVCSRELLQQQAQEQQVQARMDEAIDKHQLELFIQFYVDVDNHRIVGGEALSRWRHPEKGLMKPGTFVPMLEREGKIHKLDLYCLRECCAFLQQLVACGVEDFFLSCNFSRETFELEDFVQRCREIIQNYQFPRELLIFELTESTSTHNLTQIRSNMLAMKELGISIVLDDFGEGFTSFADLQQYPVDGIKLDKGLIDNIMTDNGLAILRAMVQVGHELGITILAEGVEDYAQAQILREIHCDVIQGYHFYQPMPQKEAKNKILEQFCIQS